MKTGLSAVFVSLLLVSCGDNQGPLTISNPAIREAVEQRKEAYAYDVLSTCKRDILNQADQYVDSLIEAEISFQINDSIMFPQKPEKPEWPGAIIIPDTIIARPIFGKK